MTSEAKEIERTAPGPALPPELRALAPAPAPAPRRRRLGRWLIGLVVLLLAAGTAWWTLWRPVTVTVVQPWRGSAIEAVYATGVVEAVDLARVGTTIAGRIVSLAVDEGDRVKKGDVVAQLDDRQARHRLEDSAARLVQAEKELARGRELQTKGVRTIQEMERAQEERDQATAAVRLAARIVDDHRILAPLDGIVTKRPVEIGETVGAQATLYEIVSESRLRVAADVDERDIPQVRMGADVALRSDAFPREAFRARITNIRHAADTATRTFRVEAALPEDTKLRIGMTVDVNVVTAETLNALLIPTRAVRNDTATGGRPGPAWVFRARDGVVVRTPVETGAVGIDATEVRSGLNDKDTVVLTAPSGLRDGQAVTTEQAQGR